MLHIGWRRCFLIRFLLVNPCSFSQKYKLARDKLLNVRMRSSAYKNRTVHNMAELVEDSNSFRYARLRLGGISNLSSDLQDQQGFRFSRLKFIPRAEGANVATRASSPYGDASGGRRAAA